MKIYILKNDSMHYIMLPEKVEGNHWITDVDKFNNDIKVINIVASNDSWNVLSNKEFFIYNYKEKKYVSNFAINNYDFCSVHDKYGKKLFSLFGAPSYEKFQNCLLLGNKPVYYLGSSEDNDIIYPYIGPKSIRFIIENNVLSVENLDATEVFINNIKMSGKTSLYAGDTIFINNIRMIVKYKEKTLSLIINNPNNLVTTTIPLDQHITGVYHANIVEPEDEEFIPLYSDEDYFHKSPKFNYVIEPLNIELDNPPNISDGNKNPFLLQVLPTLLMSVTYIMTAVTTVTNITSGKKSLKDSWPSLVTIGAMLIGFMLLPFITKLYTRHQKKKEIKLIRKKYSEYIDNIRKAIKEAIKDQQRILLNQYPSLGECKQIIEQKRVKLWENNIGDDKFLSISLGYGNIPMYGEIKFPGTKFDPDESATEEILNELRMEPRILTNVPISISLIDNYVIGIVGLNAPIHNYLNTLILQLITFHSYTDVKIVVFTSGKNDKFWESYRVMPYLFNNDKTIRFYANNEDDCNDICYSLSSVYGKYAEENKDDKRREFPTHYIIVTDNYKQLRKNDLINTILNSKIYNGFSIIFLNDKISTLPNKVHYFISLEDNSAQIVHNVINEMPFNILVDNTRFSLYPYAKILANIPMDIKDVVDNELPDSLGFNELFNIGKIENYNAVERWKNSNPIKTLQAPIGIGKNGQVFSLDIHEKYHGPHGLVAGMTGSGKSEWIITYIMSLALNYHPYEVQFVLIDYKGGGLAGAFENNIKKIKLPHLIGTLTNLDSNTINRSFASIESELKRRQSLFNKARDISGESTMDIYKYQRLYREKIIDIPVSHLLIISDEFAELKQQQPEFMAQLISIARIGRSLGVHLILATQKPSGIVDNQIWSNTKFRVCLRVQETQDSKDVIQCPDAAYLTQAGRFYFQVGYNEVFTQGQAAWAGRKYIPSDVVKKEVDTNINLINDAGFVLKNIPTRKKVESKEDFGEELPNLVEYLDKIAKQENIVCNSLWLPRIPDYVNIVSLVKKYSFKLDSYGINIPIGEYDAPRMQKQCLLTLPISKEGHVVIYGITGSGKENFLLTLIYSSMMYYNAKQLNYYIVDCGAQVLNMVKKSPFVGDIMGVDDSDKIGRLFKMIDQLIDNRKNLFEEYNGDYLTYCTKSGNIVPATIIIINNFEVFKENYESYLDRLVSITRDCKKFGIYFVITCNTTSGLSFKLRQNFKLVYSLQQNNIEDYGNVFNTKCKLTPAQTIGRGLVKIDDIYEFQTAKIAEDEQISNTISDLCSKHLAKFNYKANPVPTLPDVVNTEFVINDINQNKELVLGVDTEELTLYKDDFKTNSCAFITGNDVDIIYEFAKSLIGQISYMNLHKLFIINCDDVDINNAPNGICIDSNMDMFIDKLHKVTKDNYEKIVVNKVDKNSVKNHLYCFIIGAAGFKDKLSKEKLTMFNEIINDIKKLGMIHIILVDSITNTKTYCTDDWYKNGFGSAKTVWVGSGINDQFQIKVASRIRNDITDDMAFVLIKGKPTQIKYISEFNKKG